MSQKRKPHDPTTACRRRSRNLHPTLFRRFRVAFSTAPRGDIGPAESAMVMTHRACSQRFSSVSMLDRPVAARVHGGYGPCSRPPAGGVPRTVLSPVLSDIWDVRRRPRGQW